MGTERVPPPVHGDGVVDDPHAVVTAGTVVVKCLPYQSLAL
jgi:hypothetical protein